MNFIPSRYFSVSPYRSITLTERVDDSCLMCVLLPDWVCFLLSFSLALFFLSISPSQESFQTISLCDNANWLDKHSFYRWINVLFVVSVLRDSTIQATFYDWNIHLHAIVLPFSNNFHLIGKYWYHWIKAANHRNSSHEIKLGNFLIINSLQWFYLGVVFKFFIGFWWGSIRAFIMQFLFRFLTSWGI